MPSHSVALATSTSTRVPVDSIATSSRRRALESDLFSDDDDDLRRIPETQKYPLPTNTNDDVNTIVSLLPMRLLLSNVPSHRTTLDVPSIDAILSCLESRGTVAFESSATYATYASKFYSLHVGNARDVDVDVVVGVASPPATHASSTVAEGRSGSGGGGIEVGTTNTTTNTTNAGANDVILTLGRGGTVTFNGAYWDVDPTSSELTNFLIREVDLSMLRDGMMPIICGNSNSTNSTLATMTTMTTAIVENDDLMEETRGKDHDNGAVVCDFGVELSLMSVDDYDNDNEDGDHIVVFDVSAGEDNEGEDGATRDVEVGTIVDGDAIGGGDVTSAAATATTITAQATGIVVPIFASLVGLAVVGFVVHIHRRRERRRWADGDDDVGVEDEDDNEKVKVGHGGNFYTRNINGKDEDDGEYKVGEGLLPAGYQRSDCVDPIDVRGGGSTDSSSDGSVHSQDNFSWI